MELAHLYEHFARTGALSPSRAATLLQACWRRWVGRRLAAAACARQLQRVLDPRSGKYYFYNVKVEPSNILILARIGCRRKQWLRAAAAVTEEEAAAAAAAATAVDSRSSTSSSHGLTLTKPATISFGRNLASS